MRSRTCCWSFASTRRSKRRTARWKRPFAGGATSAREFGVRARILFARTCNTNSGSDPEFPTTSASRKDLYVAQQRILRDRDFVLDRQAAARAAELAELRVRIDEALRVADDRVGGLDRQVVAHAALLVVAADRSEVGRALDAAVVQVVVHREVLGGEELD